MKVKIAELKTHLSRYVQSIRDGGAPIEICVREQTVAYLTPAPDTGSAHTAETRELAGRLDAKGLQLRSRGKVSDQVLTPAKLRDGKRVKNTVLAIRAERTW